MENILYPLLMNIDPPITDNDIISICSKFLGYRPPIYMYSSLSRFLDRPKDFFDILNKKKVIFILYPTLSKYDGHWCIVIKNKYGYEFFDPYGFDIDDEKILINPINLIFNNGYINFLKLLFINTPYKFNNFMFQKMDSSINTCGYWCIHRTFYKNLNTNQYYLLISNVSNKLGHYPLDKWITNTEPFN